MREEWLQVARHPIKRMQNQSHPKHIIQSHEGHRGIKDIIGRVNEGYNASQPHYHQSNRGQLHIPREEGKQQQQKHKE